MAKIAKGKIDAMRVIATAHIYFQASLRRDASLENLTSVHPHLSDEIS